MVPAPTATARWQEGLRFADLLTLAAERDPGQEAVVFCDERITYAELQRRALQAARSLAALGVGSGSRVGILMANCVDFVVQLFGASLLGAVMVPINARFAPRELRYVIVNGDLELVITSDAVVERVDYVARLYEALPSLDGQPVGARLSLAEAPALGAVVLLGSREARGMMSGDRYGACAGLVEEEYVLTCHQRTAVRSPALMMYTSGTTAMPKGCVLSHEALVRTAVAAGRTRFRFTAEDCFWNPLPMFHMSAMLPLIGVFDAGATLLSMVHFEADAALRMIDDERATIVYCTFPAVAQALLHHPDYHPDRWRHVRLVNNVAPPDMLRAMQLQMPHTIQISAYGCTECGGVVAFNDPDDTLEQRCTTSGRPFDGIELQIRDVDTGEILPAGERGEILVRGYCVFDGYHKDAERTAAALDPEGWFHTGDIGRLGPDGRLSYLGRFKDMLKVGGENVAAVEIESYLGTHPAVTIAAVVGVPDPKYLEVPAAFIELRPGHQANAQEIIDFCRTGLARFKLPRHVRFVTAWPMSATKIQKFRLQEQLTRELSDAGAADVQP